MTYFLKKWCWESEKINIQNYVAYAQNFAKTFPSALVLFCLLINFDIFITGYYFLDQGTCIMQSFVLSYSNLLYVFSKLLKFAITTRHLCEHQNHWLGREDNIYGTCI